MGMLFNTPATLDILQKLNTFYGASNFNSLRANAAHYSNWPPSGGTHAFASTLGIVPSVGGLSQQNWRTWLGLLELHDNQRRAAGEKCVRTVGDAIHAALIDNAFHHVEFFAVPEPNGLNHISVDVSNITDVNGSQTKIITVYTLTYDQLASTPHP